MEYGEFKVKEGVYVPDMGIDYPTDDPFKRLLTVQVEDSSKGKYQFDETYPYLDKSLGYKIHNFFGFFVQWIAATFWNRTHFGLKIRGRKNLKGYEETLKNGAMCVCNHVYTFDALCVYQAIRRFRKLWIPMYAKHFNGNLSWFMRRVGGIPIPETLEGIKKFNEAFDEYHRQKEWMLLFPESTRWNYYTPLRPFKRGAFNMAYKYDIPVIPTVITYRKRRGLYRLFGKKDLPCMTIHVGKPILVNKEGNRKEELDRLRATAHSMMLEMAGIEVNPWPAVPDVE
ncbi:MAG: 1-acyl-sn-glycerol-3-phosphate acyltransferase [Bacteroidales bacterium]|nr:1-acyl-sn-glycerol-3-phosphate acyltransferase [Bacteroidales bacterium]